MHHRGQLMLMQRMIGIVPHLTREAQERMARSRRRHSRQVARRHGRGIPALQHRDAVVSARAEAEQPARVVQRASRRLRARGPSADDRHPRAAGRRHAGVRAGAPGQPEDSMYRIYRDVRFSENKAPYKTHVAASFPASRARERRGRGPVLPRVARRRLGRRRHVRAGYAAAPRGSRAHRGQPPPLPLHRRSAGVQARAGRRARGRAASTRAPRFSERSRGRGVPEVPAVSGRQGVSGGFATGPAFYPACSTSSARSRR